MLQLTAQSRVHGRQCSHSLSEKMDMVGHPDIRMDCQTVFAFYFDHRITEYWWSAFAAKITCRLLPRGMMCCG